MLQIRALSEQHLADEDSVDTLFGPKFLLERPLLEAVRAGDRAVLLIDEVDRADDEFEAFLLEVLSDYQITIPEIGTITAERPPLVVLTSNRTRELHDALKRRCLYHWVGYPSAEREVEIVLLRAPGVAETMARKVVAAVNRLRDMDLVKPPGVAETIDWVRTLDVLGETDLDARVADDTLGAVSRNATISIWCGPTWKRSPPVPEMRRLVRRGAGRFRPRAARRRAGRRLRRGADLLRGGGRADPGRPARSVLGRADHPGHPAHRHRDLHRGVSALLPRRRRARRSSSREIKILRQHRDRRRHAGARGRAAAGHEREQEAQLGLVGSDAGRAQGQVVRRLHARRTRGAAPDHDPDQADAAEAAHPPHRAGAVRARGPTRAGPCASRCGCTASRRSCSGGGARPGCGR